MKRLLSLVFILAATALGATLSAQDVKITGRVTVAGSNEPLPYASVTTSEGLVGVNTDMEGRYSISVPPKSTLVFSFIGYKTKEVALTPAMTSVDVVLEEDSQMLEAVVAVGYGTMKRSDVTGAVSSVSSELIKAAPVANVEQAMQGRVAGVTVTTGSGQPGAGAEVRVRGIGTIGDSAPIYVVDGVITDNIGFLNSNDIESMEVLKDASSTAIYGSRGANGVIIVTTKSGSEGRTNVSFEAYVGIQNRWKKLDLMGAQEQALTSLDIRGILSEKNFFNRYGFDTWLKTYKINPSKDADYPTNLDYSAIDTDWQDE
ncbi:MAG: TonB-dependent receptor plug domain-containing protein, partial [Alistipes sp.]|nr:TonB-dependent receptor plug domain-containing protein [Alistipes sp.]